MRRCYEYWIFITLLAFFPISYFFIDKSLAMTIHHWSITPLLHLDLISLLGIPEIYLLLFLALGLYFRYVQLNPLHERKAWYLLGCIAFPFLLGLVLKVILGRARPELLFSHQIFGFYGLKWTDAYWSSPSGHALTVTALVLGLGRVFPRMRYFVLIAALVIMATRLLLLRHYLSDVLFGACLAAIMVCFWSALFKFEKIS